jgi:hypothetical protein
MTEQNPELDRHYDEEFRKIMDSPEGSPVEADLGLAKFDEGRSRLHDQLSEIAANMDEISEGKEKVPVNLDGIAESLGEVLRLRLNEGGGIDELVETAFAVILADNVERIKLMNYLLGEPVMPDFKPEDLRALIVASTKNLGTISDAIDKIEQVYHIDLSEDVEQFVRMLINKHLHDTQAHSGADSQMQTIEIKKDMKEHAVDVAKIAMGVTVALAVDRLLHRR